MQFCKAQRQVQNCSSERDNICDCWVIAGQLSAGKELREQEYYYAKKGRIFIRGAPFKGSPQCSGAGAVAANCPPGSATVADNHSLGIFLPEIDVSWISV